MKTNANILPLQYFKYLSLKKIKDKMLQLSKIYVRCTHIRGKSSHHGGKWKASQNYFNVILPQLK